MPKEELPPILPSVNDLMSSSAFALDRIDEAELCCQKIDLTFATDINQIVIRNSQLVLGLISSLLLIGVGLIGFGKKTGLSTM
jgi:hypothetical protein